MNYRESAIYRYKLDTIITTISDKLMALRQISGWAGKHIDELMETVTHTRKNAKTMFQRFFAEMREKIDEVLSKKTKQTELNSSKTKGTRKQIEEKPEGSGKGEVNKTDNKVQKKTSINKRLDDLKAHGHGPQRHEGDVTEKNLEDRCIKGIDPMTGTTIDGATGAKHKYSRNATKENTPEDYVKAEEHLRTSHEFKSKVELADTIGKKQVVIEELKLKEMYGDKGLGKKVLSQKVL